MASEVRCVEQHLMQDTAALFSFWVSVPFSSAKTRQLLTAPVNRCAVFMTEHLTLYLGNGRVVLL